MHDINKFEIKCKKCNSNDVEIRPSVSGTRVIIICYKCGERDDGIKVEDIIER